MTTLLPIATAHGGAVHHGQTDKAHLHADGTALLAPTGGPASLEQPTSRPSSKQLLERSAAAEPSLEFFVLLVIATVIATVGLIATVLPS